MYIKYCIQRCVTPLTLFVSLYVSHVASAQSAPSPEVASVIASIRVSESLVDDVEASFEWRWKNPSMPLYAQAKWMYRKDGLQRLDGLFNRETEDGRQYVRHVVSAFDGKHFRRYRQERSAGIVKPDRYDIENMGPSPKTFLGYAITSCVSQYATLSELLERGEETTVKRGIDVSGHSCVEVETLLRREGEPAEQNAHRMKVWVDPACGYRPRKIELYRNDYNGLLRRFDNITLKEVQPGVWMPTEGDTTCYYHDEFHAVRTDKPQEELLALKRQERFAAFSFVEKPRGDPIHLVVHEYKVNSGIPKERFEYAFPEGTAVWDGFLNAGYFIRNASNQSELDGLVLSAAATPPTPAFAVQSTQGRADVQSVVAPVTHPVPAEAPLNAERNVRQGEASWKRLAIAVACLVVVGGLYKAMKRIHNANLDK